MEIQIRYHSMQIQPKCQSVRTERRTSFGAFVAPPRLGTWGSHIITRYGSEVLVSIGLWGHLAKTKCPRS